MSKRIMNTEDVSKYLGNQNFIEVSRSTKFKRIANSLGGYDTKDSGKVIYTN